MKFSKLVIGQSAITAAVTAGALILATQVAAVALKPRPLGPSWFLVGKAQVYAPSRLPVWWSQWGGTQSEPFKRAAAVMVFGAAMAFMLSVLWRWRVTHRPTTYGSSRWATSEDIAAAGLLAERGVVIGESEGRYLRHDGPEHIIVVAPTRSGKGVGLVIPTLLSWTQSVIVHDIKGENWQLTAGWRTRFSHCLLFNPTEPRSARYNPLLEVRKGQHEVRDVQNIADILVDPTGALELRTHWHNTSHALLVGLILHVLYAEEDKTLACVARLMSDPDHTFDQVLRRMLETNHLGTEDAPAVHPVVASTAREMLNKAENERSGVLSTAMSLVSLYRDPVVAQVTAASDWRIADLMSAKRPVSLYLVVPPSDFSRTKPLIRLMLNQIGRRLTERVDSEAQCSDDHEVLWLLDEFPQFGRLDFFETAQAFMAHYKLKAFLIAQSLMQIDKAYGEKNSIIDNCHVRVVFATNDERTAKRISDALGTTTESRIQRNYSGGRFASFLSHENVSRQEIARPLLTPGEVMQLPAEEELIFVAGRPPIRARKLRYYADENFRDRLLPAPVLEAGLFSDRPSGRTHDWAAQVRTADTRLRTGLTPEQTASPISEEGTVDEQPRRRRQRKAPVQDLDLFAALAARPVRDLLPDSEVAS